MKIITMDGSTLPFTVENIEAVLHQFYNDVRSQAQANQYLTLAQISNEAWSFSWQLLDPSKSTEAQFFGASTLQSKITNHWGQVPGDQYEALRSKLLQAIFGYIGGPKFILTRLCVAMSSFVIQTILNFWPTAIVDLMTTFSPNNAANINPHQLTCVLLELLTVLSEELNTTFMSRPKTNAVRHALENSFQSVMKLVEDVLAKNNTCMEVCEMALKCYSSWSQIGSSTFEYPSLLILTFDAVYREELCQTALETLSNIATHSFAYKYPSIVLMMVDNIAKFDNLIQEATRDKDMDKCCCIYAMVLAVAETHTKLLLNTIIEKPEKKNSVMNIMKVINYVLQCSGTPGQYPIDEICSEQAFGFWYTLQDQIVSSEPQIFEKLLLVFHPVFQSLLDTYLIKLRYPSEEIYRQWNTEEREAFRCYRQDIGDSIMFCYNILRQGALANLVAHLAIAIPAATNDVTQWQYLEACLFAFKEIAESVDIREEFYIPLFMSQLPTIPLRHLKVVSMSMEAVGAYAEWINLHPNVMSSVIPLLLLGLQSADIAPSATFALKDITRDCHSSLKPHAEQILSACQVALNGNIVMSREKVRLMSTIGHVLSIMPYSHIINYLDFFIPPIIKALQDMSAQKCDASLRTTAVLNLHMLSVLFGTLDTKIDHDSGNEQDYENSENVANCPQPVFLILQQMMPIFQTLAANWEPNEQITEALCECLKRALSTLLDDSKPFVLHMIELILYLYKRCTHSAVLDMAKQILLLFVDDEEQRQRLLSFFAEICNYTLELAVDDFRENTSVLEIFFQLLSQVLRKAFVFFKNEELNLKLLFDCGISALCLPEKQTVKASSSFLTEFITHSREVPCMLDTVNNYGEKLVINILKVIGGDSPRAVVEYMPDILIALSKKYFDNLCRWLNTFAQNDNFLPNRVNRSQREQFTRLILKERINKRKVKETVTEFSLLCRGLIGTEYATQSTLT